MSESPSDLYQRIHIVPNLDGTLTRLPEFYPAVPPSAGDSAVPSLSKDAPINHEHGTWARLFLPRRALSDDPSPSKLPIVVFVHGGGFVAVSAAHPRYQDFCTEAASRLGALIVSVEYRLAPEHRLPAAYDDVLEALTWVRDGKDEWVREFGDLSRCVMTGESAGGNIVYHAGLMAADRVNDLRPLIVKGIVMIQPYFGGSELSGSELRLVNDPVLPLDVNELMWSLALPVGATRNHEYCDPTLRGGSGLLDRVRDLEWQVGMITSDGDPLFDRAVELVKLMEKRGIRIKSSLSEGDSHGAFLSDLTKTNDLYDFVMDFLS